MIDDKTYRGKVAWFSNKHSYGFLEWEKDGVKQTDLFVHFSDIVMKDGGFKTVKKDSVVQFKLGVNAKNQPKAIEVQEFDEPTS